MTSTKKTFTVEQFELIRRLRISGVTAQQIIEAFQAFDRIDAELGSLFVGGNVNPPAHATPPVTINNSASQLLQQVMRRPPPGIPASHGSIASSNSHLVTGLKTNASLQQNNHHKTSNGLVPASISDVKNSGDSSTVVGGAAMTPQPDSNHHDALSSTATINNNNNNNSSSTLMSNTDNNVSSSSKSTTHFPLNIKMDQSSPDIDTEKYMEILLGQTPENIMEMIRRCVISLPDFNPTEVSSIQGMTETSLTQVLSGDLNSLELRIKYKVLDWFLYHLKRTDWFTAELNLMLRMHGEPEGLGVHFTPRRERFMFREKHLEVLETFFKKVQYPTPEEKEHIANECNVAMAASKGWELGEKEKMTPFNVSNWFSNRRKEIKRLAKMGGIETEKVILPSRLKSKPANYLPTFNDLMSHDPNRMLGNMQDIKPQINFLPNFEGSYLQQVPQGTVTLSSNGAALSSSNESSRSGGRLDSVNSGKPDSDNSDTEEEVNSSTALAATSIKLEPSHV